MAFTGVTLTAKPGDGYIDLSWVTAAVGSVPAVQWDVKRDGATIHTLYDVNAVSYRDLEVENNVAYSYVLTGETDAVDSAAVVAVPGPRVYGIVNPLASTIRYTTLADVTEALGVNQYDATYDDVLTQTIISVEHAIDQHLGRSFPELGQGEIKGIPETVKQVALSTAVAAYTNITAVSGDSGSDDWFGAQDVGIGEVIRREVRRSPLLTGLKVSWGVAGGGSR